MCVLFKVIVLASTWTVIAQRIVCRLFASSPDACPQPFWVRGTGRVDRFADPGLRPQRRFADPGLRQQRLPPAPLADAPDNARTGTLLRRQASVATARGGTADV